nr:Chain A, ANTIMICROBIAL PEPTIDE, TRITRPTICIN [synthetic construct]
VRRFPWWWPFLRR